MKTIRWIRNDDGALRFYKHNYDLWSDELADAGDDVIVLKAIVRLESRKTIVAVPVARELINEPAAPDWTLGKFNDEALYAAELLEKHFKEGPARIHFPTGYRTPEDLPPGAHVVDAGALEDPSTGIPNPDALNFRGVKDGLTITPIEAVDLTIEEDSVF